MVVSLKHKFASAKSDGVDTTLVRPSNWNDDHDLTLAASKLLGRATASAGAAEEVTVGTSLSLDAASQTLRRAALTGDVTASVDSNATTIATGAVTAAKIGSGAATLAKLDTTGSSGQVLTAQGSGVAPIWAAAAGGGIASVQTEFFTASGTWTKPANLVEAHVYAVGGGGHGGSSTAAGTNNNGGSGGSGGSGGGTYEIFSSADLTGTNTVTVTIGAAGSPGGATSFGALSNANGGNAGTSATTNNSGSQGTGGNGVGGDTNYTGDTGVTSRMTSTKLPILGIRGSGGVGTAQGTGAAIPGQQGISGGIVVISYLSA